MQPRDKMKEQIKQVQEYFKNKLLSNDFEIIDISEYNVKILVDSEYEFNIWGGNIDIPEARTLHPSKVSFMDIALSDEEAITLNEFLLPAIIKFRKKSLIAQKRAELEELEKDIKE